MKRNEIAHLCEKSVLASISERFSTTPDALSLYEDYEGCQNLVYDYQPNGVPLILRISFRPDRSVEQIQEEAHFVNYLAENGMRVSSATPSLNGNLVEIVDIGEQRFIAVSFIKGKGMRVPDNEYRYCPGVPIQEYFQNWGSALGQIHALSKSYQPINPAVRRPAWLERRSVESIAALAPESLPVVRSRFKDLLIQLAELPTDRDSYGLLHGDFNDGNFTLDYETGEITVFDFDDACYGWFMYELAGAWEGHIGRTMFEADHQKRKAYMEACFEQVLAGYARYNTLAPFWLECLPLFLKVVEMEGLLSCLEYRLANELPLDLDTDGEMAYLIRCIEEDIPFLGFFDPIYSPEHPFSLYEV